MSEPTKAQMAALRWLGARNGDGALDRHGVAFAAGETAPFMRSTWNTLRDLGWLEFYRLPGTTKGYGRLRLTPEGNAKLGKTVTGKL